MSNEERKNLHEVADSELEAAGGLKDGNRKVITLGNSCGWWRCRTCILTECDHHKHHTCENCCYMSYDAGLWHCNNYSHNNEV